MTTPIESAEWIIEQLQLEANLQGSPLSDDDLDTLRLAPWEIDGPGPALVPLNNRVVKLARSAMDRAKHAGAPTVKPRRGLVIPADWYTRYQVIFVSEMTWLLSGALQNAMLNNPFAGERRNWKSK